MSVGPDVEETWFAAMNFMARQLDRHGRYREFVSDPEPIPRVPEIGIHTVISHRSVSVIARTMRSTRLWRDSSLFERVAVGIWIAVGAAEEVVAT
jgi:hypothetical protein